MSNEASNTAESHSAAKRTLALLTLVALLVTFSSVRVADAEDPSLDDVASTLDQAGLLASTTSDPDADVAVDGSSEALAATEASIADELLVEGVAETDTIIDIDTAAVPSDQATSAPQIETSDLDTDDLTATSSGTNAADDLAVSEPTDDSTGAEVEADLTYTEEDAVADATAAGSEPNTGADLEIYTEEDAVAASNETSDSLPVHGYPVHTLSDGPATSDDAVVLEIESDSAEDEADTPISSGFSNGGVDSNDYLVGADGRPVDGIPIHDVSHLSPAAIDESPTSAAFGNLLVDTVSNTVSQAITQALPHRNWVPVLRPVSEIVIPAPEADETSDAQLGEQEDLLIFAAGQPGPPPAASDDAAVADELAEVSSIVVTTTTPETTTTTAPTPVTEAPTTLVPTTVAARPRPAPPTTVASPAAVATPAVTTTAVPATTTTAPPVTVAPTTTVAPTSTTVALAPSTPAEAETAAPPTTEVVEKEEEVDFVDHSGSSANMIVQDDDETSAEEQALDIPSPLGAFEFRGNAARLGAVWALWVLGTVAIMALWLPIPALRRNTNSSLPRRRS